MALQNTAHASAHKLAYLCGVFAYFNAFALIIVFLQTSGQQVGWGFHMQEPIVVTLLAFLFTFIALVLLDALAVGSRLSGLGQSLISGDTAFSHFATGLLAVIVASPCTAPFMAAALGLALVSEPAVTFLLFNALALGFALPLTLLFMSPKALAWLPKPGAWMETFKHFLAFPMLATVAWLCWVFAGQAGSQSQFGLLIALILFAMFVWLFGQSKKLATKAFNSVGILLSITLSIGLSLNASSSSHPQQTNIKNNDARSQVFSQENLLTLREQNKIVVVNMTADWCITCKVNEQVALSSKSVTAALAEDDVVYMVGDWTNKNAEILSYLNQYDRAGVPLYVVYAGQKSKQVLPQLLSPDAVIDAINEAREHLNATTM